MSRSENQVIIDQIRSKYKKAAMEFGKRYFDTLALEERILTFIQSKIDIMTFVKHEMEFYNRLKEMASEKRQKEKDKQDLHRRMEAIMDANNEKIRKYPDSGFDPRASFEIRHMAGAIEEVLPLIEYVARRYIRGLEYWERMNQAIVGVEKFRASGPGKMSIWLKGYIEDAIAQNGMHMEKLDREYLQSAGVALKELQISIESVIENETSAHIRYEVLPDDSNVPPAYTRIRGLRVLEALQKLSRWIHGILMDFRLMELAEFGQKKIKNI